MSEHWDLTAFLHYRHMQVTFGGLQQWLLDDVLQLDNLSRDIVIDMPDFHSAMSLCEQTDLLLCAPAKHAARMARHYRLQTLSVPVEMQNGVYLLLWHRHFDHDRGHQWLRELIINSVKQRGGD